MLVAVEWLNSVMGTQLSPKELADAMELAGIEVEEVAIDVPLDDKITVGKLIEVKTHPNADRLKLTKVQVENTTLSIVCGANNIELGQLVPVAVVGTILPDGTEILASKIRGVISEGMLCSERELGVSQNHAGIMILDEDADIGQKINEIITTSDHVNIKTATNRWDLNSLNGLAAEVVAQISHKFDPWKVESADHAVGEISNVQVDDDTMTTSYMLAGLSVEPGLESPNWMRRRLQAAGVRPINAVVDVTNYVMVEYGQPLHAFDASKVKGGVKVRRAHRDEKLETLDHVSRQLEEADVVIADDAGAIGFAGVMGGANSEIDAVTTRIYLEAASFDAVSLRKTAVRHGLRTDASARFERGIPVDLVPIALLAAIKLLIEHAGAKLTAPAADIVHRAPEKTDVAVSLARINGLLGLQLDSDAIVNDLERLHLKVEAGDNADALTVAVPWWRPDITEEADVAEELVKLVGHANLPATIPAWRAQEVNFDHRWANLWKAKDVLRSLRLFETTTYSFISEQQITDLAWKADEHMKLRNPLSSEQSHLRHSLLPSLLATMARNRGYAKQFGLFEFSKVFLKRGEGELPDEPLRLGVMTLVPAQGGYSAPKAALDRLAHEFNVPVELTPRQFDAVTAHPSRAAIIKVKDLEVGRIAQLHPALVRKHKLAGEIGYLELDWDKFLAAAQPKVYRPVAKYPLVERDIAVLIKREITWQRVSQKLTKADFKVDFINDYYGADLPEGQKSLALRLTLSNPQRTLADKEAEQGVERALTVLKDSFDARPRQ